ncbi:unnamed protein product [Lathyrus oleraceus]
MRRKLSLTVFDHIQYQTTHRWYLQKDHSPAHIKGWLFIKKGEKKKLCRNLRNRTLPSFSESRLSYLTESTSLFQERNPIRSPRWNSAQVVPIPVENLHQAEQAGKQKNKKRKERTQKKRKVSNNEGGRKGTNPRSDSTSQAHRKRCFQLKQSPSQELQEDPLCKR